MPDSVFDKMKEAAQKAAVSTAMLVQSATGMGQNVASAYSSENSKTQDEVVKSPTADEPAEDILLDAFQTTARDEYVDDLLDDEQPTVSSIQKKYGFDIIYNPQKDKFLLKQDGDYDRGLPKDMVEYDSWEENMQKNRKEIYSHDTKFNFHDVDLLKHLEEGRYIYIARQKSDNSIDFYQYHANKEDKEKCLELLQKKCDMSAENAEKFFDFATNPDVTSKLSLIEHEITHSIDTKKSKLDQYDLPPYLMGKLEMFTEIHAYMEQAGMALDMYKATGDVKYFDDITAVDMSAVKEGLLKNPDMENKEGFVASYLYNQFLKEQNKDDTTYSDQAATNASYNTHDYRVWSFVSNDERMEEYHNRVKAMFENVNGLGNVCQYIDPDFELHQKLQEELEPMTLNDNFEKLMTSGANSPREYAENLMNYLQIVKEADADGVRTAEESARLQGYIDGKLFTYNENASDHHDAKTPSAEDRAQIMALSGRSGRYLSPEAIEAEKAQAMTMQTPEQNLSITNEQVTGQNISTKEAPATERTAAMPAVAPTEKQPNVKPADSMSQSEAYVLIQKNLRMGKNPNLSAESAGSQINDNTGKQGATLSDQNMLNIVLKTGENTK